MLVIAGKKEGEQRDAAVTSEMIEEDDNNEL